MTSRERMLIAMSGGTPDRVPCAPDTNYTIPQRLTGLPSWDIYYHEKVPIWKAYNDCVRYFGVDGFSHHGFYEIPFRDGCRLDKSVIQQDEEKMVLRMDFSSPAGNIFLEETYLRDEPPTPTIKHIDDFVEQYEILKYFFFGDIDKISFSKYKEMQKDMGENGVVGLCMLLPTLLTHWRQPTEAAFYDYFDHHELLTEFIGLWTDISRK